MKIGSVVARKEAPFTKMTVQVVGSGYVLARWFVGADLHSGMFLPSDVVVVSE